MKRVPSLGDIASKTPLAAKATVVASASTMLAATATIVSHSSAESVETLVGAVASMVGAAATIASAFDAPQGDIATMEYVANTGVLLNGVLIGEHMERAGLARLDVRVSGRVGTGLLLAECTWDGPGEQGVFLNGVKVDDACSGIELRIVGKGRLF